LATVLQLDRSFGHIRTRVTATAVTLLLLVVTTIALIAVAIGVTAAVVAAVVVSGGHALVVFDYIGRAVRVQSRDVLVGPHACLEQR
jgi:hypothetical protein